MNAKLRRRVKRILLALVATYLIGGAVLYFAQDKILFHPEPLPQEHRFLFEQPFEDVNIPSGNENLSIVKFRPSGTRKGIVLFYHGNRRNVEHYRQYPSIFLRNQLEVWMIDYPGFGKTTGKRTENIIREQALRLYAMAAAETVSDSILIYGKSIGTGVAAYVAARKKCRQLILETPYYSIPSLAGHYFPVYPVKMMLRYSFPVHSYLATIKQPVTIFHGIKDEIIPYKQSVRLKEENAQLELVTIKNGRHNDLPGFDVFQKKMDSILSR